MRFLIRRQDVRLTSAMSAPAAMAAGIQTTEEPGDFAPGRLAGAQRGRPRSASRSAAAAARRRRSCRSSGASPACGPARSVAPGWRAGPPAPNPGRRGRRPVRRAGRLSERPAERSRDGAGAAVEDPQQHRRQRHSQGDEEQIGSQQPAAPGTRHAPGRPAGGWRRGRRSGRGWDGGCHGAIPPPGAGLGIGRRRLLRRCGSGEAGYSARRQDRARVGAPTVSEGGPGAPARSRTPGPPTAPGPALPSWSGCG